MSDEKICTLVSYEDLPPEEQEFQPNNGSGKEYATYLKVKFPGSKGKAEYYSDAMEPEDARLYRDLSWVSAVIEEAHKAGFEAGYNSAFDGISQ